MITKMFAIAFNIIKKKNYDFKFLFKDIKSQTEK